MRSLVLFLLLFSLVSCQTPESETPMTEAVRQQVEQEVGTALSSLFDTCETYVAEDCFAHHWPDGSNVTQGEFRTILDWQTEWSRWAERFDRQIMSPRQVEIEALSPTVALSVVTSQWYSIDTLGVSADTLDFAHTGLWKKENGEWRVWHEHQSFVTEEE